MSFAVHARRVRDPGLPLHRRHSALGSAIVLYAPFGYRRTWAYLGMKGDLRRDPEALVRALDALELSRRGRIAELDAFAERRRAEKREQHRRSPSAADTARFAACRWWGPEGHRAAVAMVRLLWTAHHGPFPPVPGEHTDALAHLDSAVSGHVSSYLAAAGAADPERTARLRALLPELREWRGRLGHLEHVDRLAAMAEVIVGDAPRAV